MQIIVQDIPNTYSSRQSVKGIDTQYKAPSTLQPLENESQKNAELEINETAILPDLTGFYKVGGKTHKQGGTPVLLDEGTFIFSNDKSLVFSNKEKELLELPKGGNWKRNTPAALSLRTVNPKDYNKWMQIMSDDNKDDVSKKSAGLMAQSTIQKLGAIAAYQEKKKQFPDGIPFFSEGTMPVYTDDVKDDIKQQPQFMRKGGYYQKGGLEYGNPYNKKQGYLYTDSNGQKYTQEELASLRSQYAQYPTLYGGIDYFNKQFPNAETFLYSSPNQNPLQPMGFTTTPNKGFPKTNIPTQTTPAPVNYLYGVPASGTTSPAIVSLDLNPQNSRATGEIPTEDTLKPLTGITSVPKMDTTPGIPKLTKYTPPAMTQPSYETRRVWQNVPLSPLQQANAAFLGARALSQRPQYPLRINERFTDVNPELLNPDQLINNINTNVSLGLDATNSMNPILGAANLQLLQGKGIEQASNTLSAVNNQNLETRTRASYYNAAGRDRVYNANQGHDFDYQNQINQANLNTYKDRIAAENVASNYLNSSLEGNQKLEQFLNSQRTYGRNKTPVRDSKGNILYYEAATPFTVDNTGWSPRVGYNTNAEFDVTNINIGRNNIDSMPELIASYQEFKKLDPTLTVKDFAKLKGINLLTSADAYPIQRMGGRYMKRKTYKVN